MGKVPAPPAKQGPLPGPPEASGASRPHSSAEGLSAGAAAPGAEPASRSPPRKRAGKQGGGPWKAALLQPQWVQVRTRGRMCASAQHWHCLEQVPRGLNPHGAAGEIKAQREAQPGTHGDDAGGSGGQKGDRTRACWVGSLLMRNSTGEGPQRPVGQQAQRARRSACSRRVSVCKATGTMGYDRSAPPTSP